MAHDPLDAARASYSEARAAIGQYRLPDARRHIDEARRLLERSTEQESARMELALRIQLTESWLTCDESGLVPALVQVREARERAESAGRRDLQALAHIQAGVLLARAGQFPDALDELRPAVDLSPALAVDDRVRLLINKGTISSQHGNLAEAADDLAEAAALAGTDLPDYAFMATHNLGFVEYLRGDLPAALAHMLAADGMEAPVDRSVARLDRARVLMEAGLVDDADHLLASTVEAMRAAGMTEELGDALLDRARCSLLRGRAGEAIELANEVVGLGAERGDPHRGLAAAVVRLEALVSQRTEASVLEEVRRLEASADAAGMVHLADRAAALGAVAAARGHRPPPTPELADRLARMRRSPYLSTRLLAVHAALVQETDAHRRTRLVRVAMRDLAAAKSGLASLDLRTALTLHSWPIIQFDLQTALADGRAWRVLTATERWRSALRTVPSVVPPNDATVAELWSQLKRTSEELRSASPDAAAQREVVQLERRIRERSWARQSSRASSAGGRFRRGDARGHVLLSYFWLDERLHGVEVAPGRASRLHRLGGRDEITELVSRAGSDAAALALAPPGPLSAAVSSSLEDSLARLDALVLPAGLAPGPVVIVPSGSLARLPWGMLPGLRERPVTLTGSLSAWSDGATVLDAMPGVAVADGPGLRHGEREARQVRTTWPAAARLAGHPASVKEALTKHDVVHIAAHGRHRADNPLFSSLLLRDGDLYAHELEHLAIRSSLVILSACSAGRSRVRPGDEALGLTASLLALGVKAVVAPLTDVPDELAGATMAALHERLAAGVPGPRALQEASSALLARSFSWFGSNWQVSPRR